LSINVQGGAKAISTEGSKLIEITDNMLTLIGCFKYSQCLLHRHIA